MTHILSLLPALGCLAMMLGGGTLLRLATRTPVARWRGLRALVARGEDRDSARPRSDARF
jgi:hypothetical protein